MPNYDQHILKDLYERVLNPPPVIKEAYMTVPEKVYKPIKDYYMESYKKIKLEEIKRIGSKNFPVKNFVLDFSGTEYEHLNQMSPKASVDVQLSLGKESYYGNSLMRFSNKGFIQLDFNDFKRGVYDLIEHEVLHLVQYMIEEYNKKYKNIKNSDIGGLPSKKMMPKGLKTSGFLKRRRAEHSKRPVEYYPDLLSSVRELQYKFYTKYHNMDNWKEMKESEKYKKEYFLDFLDAVKNGQDFGRIASYVFKQFKEISKPFYRKMLALAYDAFVNRPWNFDPEEIKSALHNIGTELVKKAVEKQENKEEADPNAIKLKYVRDLEIGGYNSSDILGDLQDYDLNINDGLVASSRFVLEYLGVKEKQYGKYDDSEFRLPKKSDGISKLFRNLRRLKEKNHNLFDEMSIIDNDTDKSRDINEEEISLVYKSIYEELKRRYMDAAIFDSKENMKKLIDTAYSN